MTDGERVRRALQGDSASLGELAESWSARVFAFCLTRCHNRHLAEDLAQEALLRALRNLRSLKDPDRFGPWLRGIALRAYLDWRKSRQTSQVSFSTLGSADAVEELLASQIDSTADHEDDVNWLSQELALLDNDLRETILLYYSHAMTYAELADLLDVSPATINVRLTRARMILRSRAALNRDDDRAISRNVASSPPPDEAPSPVSPGRIVLPEQPPFLATQHDETRQP